jgi:hypothetical protein
MRQPRTAQERILLTELMEARFKYLRKNKNPIVFLEPPAFYQPNATQLVSDFYVYTSEMGLSYERFKALLSDQLVKVAPDRFITGPLRWSDGEDVALLRKYAKRSAASPWIVAKLREYLAQPDALASDDAKLILSALGPPQVPTAQCLKNQMEQVVTRF